MRVISFFLRSIESMAPSPSTMNHHPIQGATRSNPPTHDVLNSIDSEKAAALIVYAPSYFILNRSPSRSCLLATN
uniref:Uncharacterized protein n=1 Tax=Oryza brachyantha TaxID=4533 RepID=J3MPA3_ORYBR